MVSADISQQTAGRRMAYPDKPQQQFSYTAFQQGQGDNSFPGTQLDNDLANQRASIEATIEFLRSALRSDGRVANASIGREQLAADISLGFDPPQVWAAGGEFSTGNSVFIDNRFYIATQDHTAQADFADDLAAGRWTLLVDFQAATTDAEAARDAAQTAQGLAEDAQTGAETARTGSETARDAAQTAQGLAEGARDDAQAARTGAAAAQGLAEGARDDAQTARTGSETARDKAEAWASEAEDTPVETSPDRFSGLHWAAKAAAAGTAAEDAATTAETFADAVQFAAVPIGAIVPFASPDPVDGYLDCHGQIIDETYPELRQYLLDKGSPYGESGGHPRAPELRGEAIRGWDDGRGVDAGRVFGSSQLDQMQRIVGQIGSIRSGGNEADDFSGVFSGSQATNNGSSFSSGDGIGPLDFDTVNSPDARVSDTTDGETRMRNVALCFKIKAYGEINLTGQATLDGLITQVNALLAEQKHVPVRQTVLTGPVDANGRADFLEASSGLVVQTKGTTTDTLRGTFGDGFNDTGEVNWMFKVDTQVSWSDLPDDEDNVYLYLEYDADTQTLSTGHSTLAPDYSLAKPSSPSTGQYWYPTDHRSRGERWDGSAWVPVLRVYVGECATSGGSVASVTSYVYQGEAEKQYGIGDISGGGATSFAHNLGVPTGQQRLRAWIDLEGDSGRLEEMTNKNIGGGANRNALQAESRNNCIFRRESSSAVIMTTSNAATSVAWNSRELLIRAQRAF